jgi:glyoxylase-like metal-dependent hydrolase (beta-lactamase superfamily II)
MKSSPSASGATLRLHEAAPDIWQLRMPLDVSGLDHSNVFLIREDRGWCAFDTGIDTKDAREVWSAALAGPFKEGLSRIVVSHHHPDHLGLASWLREITGAPVIVRPEELSAARAAGIADPGAEPGIREFFRRNGMPAEDVDTMVNDVMKTFYACAIPEQTQTVEHGQRMAIGRYGFEVMVTGGHSVAQVSLHDPSNGVFLCGDQMLEWITSNVGLWPYGDAHPLANHLRSLDEIASREVKLVLPAHHDVYAPEGNRAEALRAHHVRMLSVFRERLQARMTAWELSQAVYGKLRDLQHRVLALVETLAHLQWLRDAGDIACREERDTSAYERIA